MSVLTLRVVKSGSIGSIGSIDTFKVQQRKFIFWVDFKECGVVRTFDSLVLANMYAQLKARSMKGKFIDRKIKSNVV